MRTVICLDNWIFAGIPVEGRPGELVLDDAKCLQAGAGKWSPPKGQRVTLASSAIIAVIEG